MSAAPRGQAGFGPLTRQRKRAGPLFGLAAIASFAGVGAALVSQHAFAMEPCAWCVLQRLLFVVIAVAALVGLAVRRVGALLVALLSFAGVASASWQHFVAARSASCDLTLADRIVSGLALDRLLPDVFAVRASCADAAVRLLGMPYEFWSFALYVAFAVISLRLLFARESG